jgi:hypothetical protein
MNPFTYVYVHLQLFQQFSPFFFPQNSHSFNVKVCKKLLKSTLHGKA